MCRKKKREVKPSNKTFHSSQNSMWYPGKHSDAKRIDADEQPK